MLEMMFGMATCALQTLSIPKVGPHSFVMRESLKVVYRMASRNPAVTVAMFQAALEAWVVQHAAYISAKTRAAAETQKNKGQRGCLHGKSTTSCPVLVQMATNVGIEMFDVCVD